MYNSDLVKANEVPTKFEDIFNPKWKGKIATTPYVAGMREFGMSSMLGPKVMTEFTKRPEQPYWRVGCVAVRPTG